MHNYSVRIAITAAIFLYAEPSEISFRASLLLLAIRLRCACAMCTLMVCRAVRCHEFFFSYLWLCMFWWTDIASATIRVL